MEASQPIERRKRALSSDGARHVRQQGYDDALEFALSIGVSSDYTNNLQAKKDVVDPSGDTHSLKGGLKKWQVFLYGRNRFESDDAWRVMDGIGDLFVQCIDSFPATFEEYQVDKLSAKEKLRIPMRALSEKLQDKARLRALLNKSLFNGGEVDYLTTKHNGIFDVFLNKDVVDVLAENLEVTNSRMISKGNVAEQKVLLRFNKLNLGELEMRNDSEVHYREIRFNMVKPKVMALLLEKIPITKTFNEKVMVHGNASKRFGRWINKETPTGEPL